MNIGEAIVLLQLDPWFSAFDMRRAVNLLTQRVVEDVVPTLNRDPMDGLADMAKVDAEIMECGRQAAI